MIPVNVQLNILEKYEQDVAEAWQNVQTVKSAEGGDVDEAMRVYNAALQLFNMQNAAVQFQMNRQ